MLHHIEDTAAALRGDLGALLRPGGRLALADLDTEDGSFHDPDAEGIHHLGFDRDASPRLSRRLPASSTWRCRTAHVYDERARFGFPMFLLTATRT